MMRLIDKVPLAFTAKSSENFLLESYLSSIDRGEIIADPDQKLVVLELNKIYQNVLPPVENKKTTTNSWLTRLVKKKQEVVSTPTGLYLWGGVGRGKTHLVDFFYKLVPVDKKLRLHFYRFMQLVHDELNQLDSVSDPLKQVARNMAEKTSLLCLDEMHVNDITDAMLLGRLFKYLFQSGVVLITTSNIPPEKLYKDGLQREQFLPAIKLLQQYTQVVEMGGNLDYRLKSLEQDDLYHLACGVIADQHLEEQFHKLSAIELHQDRTDVIVNRRRLPVKMWADGVVWFTFDQICNTARSAEDYIQIAHFFHTVLISDIPVMDSNIEDAARRFVIMIDSFYDFHVNLVVSAEAKPDKLYTGKKLAFEFKRTASRLREMQSKEYITVKHLS